MLRALVMVSGLAAAMAVPLTHRSHSQAGVCTFVSATTVVSAGTKNVVPPANNCAGADCSLYLLPASCLGVAGPISAMGPLGILGPIGSRAWNPSAWFSGLGDWAHYSSSVAANSANPLSAAGPLGAYNAMSASPNDFVKHLQAHGLWTVLGPLGPLGPLGVLGPLGPLGIHGFARDSKTGGYFDSKKVLQRQTKPIAWDAKTTRTWDLFEYYPSVKAAQAVKQDTSFMYESNIAVDIFYNQTPDVVEFTTAVEQFVTVIAVPERMSDAFHVTLTDSATGKVIAASTETYFINWIQVHAAAGQRFKVSTQLGITSVPSPTGFSYRLYVVGGSNLVTKTPVTGRFVHTA